MTKIFKNWFENNITTNSPKGLKMLSITETCKNLPNYLKRYGKVKNFENQYSDNSCPRLSVGISNLVDKIVCY